VGRARGALVEISAARRGDPTPASMRFGASVVCFRRNGVVLGFFELWDPPREGAERALRALWQRGLGCRLLSGDGHEATLALAHKLGVPALGGLGPVEKALHVRDLQHEGARVLHVGDGRTDPASFGHADVMIAVAPGTLPTAVTAPLVLCVDRLDAVAWLLDLARALRTRVRICIGIGLVHNAVVIPLCAAGLLGPLAAAALTLASTSLVCVVVARLLQVPALPAQRKAAVELGAVSTALNTSRRRSAPLLR
jgi:P-type E1-E2 ATPase